MSVTEFISLSWMSAAGVGHSPKRGEIIALKNHLSTGQHDIRKMVNLGLSILFFLALLSGCSPKVPEYWRNLGMPSEGLVKVYDYSDSNGFYADYRGYTSEDLSKRVATRLIELGFTEVCSEFDGSVKGFQNRDKKYIVKVDNLGGKIGLSVFDENGADPLVYAICFKGYKLSDPARVK